MVQLLLRFAKRNFCTSECGCAGIVLLLLITTAWASKVHKEKAVEPPRPTCCWRAAASCIGSAAFSSEKEMEGKRGFFDQAGGRRHRRTAIIRIWCGLTASPSTRADEPSSPTQARTAFTSSISKRHKYKFIERRDKDRDAMRSPQCIAVDAHDNIYVTDSEAGKIFVFDPSGKFRRTIGSLKGGEGYFKRPTGIAVDSAAERIYVTDTLRDKIFVLDMNGSVLQTIGQERHRGWGVQPARRKCWCAIRICLSWMR